MKKFWSQEDVGHRLITSLSDSARETPSHLKSLAGSCVPLLHSVSPAPRMSTMESKGEISDTDSGIILQSGPDSPISPMKELTHAMRKQQRALEEHLELCLEELKKLCLREAELTGILPQEYPLKPGEKAPKVRRRIGAAYKLDEQTLRREDPLSSLEQELALQLQIAEAARRLYKEENLTKQIRRRRKHAVLQEEKKLRELEHSLHERRLSSGCTPLSPATMLRGELSTSDDSSLSDAVLLEEEEAQLPKPVPESPAPPTRALPPQRLEGLKPAGPEIGGPERSPIQNSPWKETSLDHPYEKPKKSPSDLDSESSPATTPQDGPSSISPWMLEAPTYHVVPLRNIPGQVQGRASAPATPEIQGRRGQSQSLRVDSFRVCPEGRGRSAIPRRRPTHYTVTVPDSCFPSAKHPLPHPAYHSGSEDSSSDVSSISHPTSPGSSSPDIFLRPMSPSDQFCSRRAWVSADGRELAAYCPKLLLPSGYFPAERYVMVADRQQVPAGWELCRLGPGAIYDEDGTFLRYQRLVPSHSRIVRTPSLKDSPAGRGLSKAAVSEELKWWHERARLRSARPHSLDRQGAFRMRSLPPSRESFGRVVGRTQMHVLKRTSEGTPMQVYVPENGEIISQV
ncbi:innate immunity activator protein isoform X2 [Antechinus flavipes]|uniref:innate immunity activator protein isoform X2 n=1 Tax=Antechinus flavipes TaxID=38775 RepID=UPI0022359EA2|nr:innate immunity activator protein isoform X2 [Antechinus flavipes]